MTLPQSWQYRPIMPTAPTPLTIMFWPESAYGPTNQCIGLAAILRDRGHTIVFAAESSWAGKLAPFGFVEELVDLAEPAAGASDDDAGKFWTDFIAETAPEFRKPTVEQLRVVHPAHLSGAHRRREVLRAAAARDHRHAPPRRPRRGQRRALPRAGDLGCAVRADRVVQPAGGARSRCAAAVLRAARAPTRSQWEAYRAEFDRTHRAMWADFDAWVQAQGAEPLPDLEFMPRDERRQPLRLSGRGRLSRRPAARRQLDPDGLQRARDRRRVRGARRGRRPARRQRAGLPVAGLARRRRRRADAAAGRRARHDPAPLHRQQGTAGRSNHAGRTTWSARRCCRRPR